MARKFSTIGFNPMVESVNRKFARNIDTCTDKTITVGGNRKIPGQLFMGAYTRNADVVGIGQVKKNIMFFRVPIAAPTRTSNQLDVRTKFIAATKWARDAHKDLSVIAANQEKWKAARANTSKSIKGVSAFGYQTMVGWMTAIAYQCAVQDGQVPATGALPAFDA